MEMWSVSAITLFSLTRCVSCFLLTFNADTHFGFVSPVTDACDVPHFVRLSCRRRNSSLRRHLGLRFGTAPVSRQTNEALRPSDGKPEVIGWSVGLVLTNLCRHQLSNCRSVSQPRYWYDSAEATPPPPVTSTWPLLSNVAVCWDRAVVMLPVGVNVPLDGSNSSANASG